MIVNGGNNPVKDGFKVLHHDNWDKHLNARGHALKHEESRFRVHSERLQVRQQISDGGG